MNINYLNKNNNLLNYYAILSCFFFFNFLAPEFFFNICECRGVLNNGNGVFPLMEMPIVHTNTPFAERVLTITNISFVFITPVFTQILEPIFFQYPMHFQEAIFPVEFLNELLIFEPFRTNQELFQFTQNFISEQLEGIGDEERNFMLNNIIITPEECQILINDFRQVYDSHMAVTPEPGNLLRN